MYKYFLKWLFDFILAFLALVILSPMLVLIIIGLLLTGEHYVFYFQNRVGYKNRPFSIWKFATMIKNSPNMGTGSLTLRNDSRVLPMGGFLRRTKINELPQFVNVLIGNMSLIGPRPLMEVDFLKYAGSIQEKIYNCKPGVSGIASLVFRDEEKLFSETTMDPHDFNKKFVAPYKGALEVWYQENVSLFTDIKIIILTIGVILNFKDDLVYKWFNDLPDRPNELN